MKSIFLRKPVNANPFLTLIFFLILPPSLNAQKDKFSRIADIENQLKNHRVTISEVLTNKDYEQLHPETEFRELAKKFAPSGIIAITPANEPGKKIKVIVTLKNKDDQPISDGVVYLYHTDSRGWYAADAPHVLMNEGDRKHARLFGYVRTDKYGQFELQTIKPRGYPQSDLPAHIHIEINDSRNGNKITELLFDDDDRLKGTIRANAEREGYSIAKPQAAQAPFMQKFSYVLKL